jgi:chromosome segregation ATPase
MFQKYFIIVLTLSLLIFSSCVSKKKFLEMQDGRLKAEELSRKLNEENNDKAARIEALIKDFENMKNELMQSNAQKDHYIDSLNSEVFTLTEQLNRQQESLQETSFNLDFEKQRLTNALKSKDQTIDSMQEKVDELENSITNKNTVIDQKNFDINRLEDELSLLEGKLKTSEGKQEEINERLKSVQAEVAKLQSLIKEKDAAITRLENNVKLLKKQLGN